MMPRRTWAASVLLIKAVFQTLGQFWALELDKRKHEGNSWAFVSHNLLRRLSQFRSHGKSNGMLVAELRIARMVSEMRAT